MDDNHEMFYFTSTIIAFESIYRFNSCNPFQKSQSLFLPCVIFLGSFILVIIVALLDLKHVKFLQSGPVRNTLTMLHLIDGPVIVILGLGLYYEHNGVVALAVIANTKLFLLSFITRMVTACPVNTKFEALSATTRSYFHHVGSFFFVAHRETILVTSAWRFLSMSGHALLAWKTKEYESLRQRYVIIFSYIRQAAMVAVILICYAFPSIRRGFGKTYLESPKPLSQ